MKEFFEVNIGLANKDKIATININETLPLPDKNLLLKWYQEDIEKDQEGEEKKKDYYYATAIMPGYENVRNLSSEEAWKVFNYKNTGEEGQRVMASHINNNSPTLLLPLQAGVCPYNCKACPFARNFPANEGKKTKMIGVQEARVLIQQSLKQAEENNIDISNIGISFVGSGDATPNPYLEEIFQMITTEFPNVLRVRFSTVAANPPAGRLTPMQVVAKIISDPNYRGQPEISMQVSVHNTDENERAAYVFDQKLHSPEVLSGEINFTVEDAKEKLLPLNKVALQFEQIVEAQRKRGFEKIRKPTLTFVCTKDTKIDIEALKNYGFNKENTVIQLRPILSEDSKDCMSEEIFSSLYNKLGFAGYDVVLMPVSPSGVELKTG